MSAYLLLLLCPLLGLAFRRWSLMPEGTPAVLNAWMLRVALPALVLEQIPRLHLGGGLLVLVLAPWLVIGGAALFIPMLGRRFGWDRGTVGALVITCGLGNTAFVGLPMIDALLGKEALGYAVMADQIGTFLALATAGIALAAYYSGGRITTIAIALRVLRFPPFVALLCAIAVRVLGGWPPVIEPVLHRLGDTLTPLALFSVGLQFHLGQWSQQRRPMMIGLGWKLAVAPLLVWALGLLTGAQGYPLNVSVLQAAMAPMITAGVLAVDHRLNPPLANLTLSIGTLLSFVTVPVFAWLMR